MSTTKALLIIADGSEEMEAVITADVLRRAKIDVTVAGLDGDKPVKCSRNIVLMPDTSLEQVREKEFDVIILPGGLGGSEAFAASELLGTLLKKQESIGKDIAAICAAPIALKSHKILLGKKITCYPGVVEKLKETHSVSEDRVVIDGNLITSRGPGTAFEFGLAMVEKYVGKEQAKTIGDAMLVKIGQ
ncbi:protein dj-1beta-like isoform X1 [Brevipalpus obovatus]|uniref:protein dj-1beta-like isoform X1 n=1 Tax=Brevipalpus obovatus TaxID=246614 RepID=UPI003D9E8012